jgi:hypothetical protein
LTLPFFLNCQIAQRRKPAKFNARAQQSSAARRQKKTTFLCFLKGKNEIGALFASFYSSSAMTTTGAAATRRYLSAVATKWRSAPTSQVSQFYFSSARPSASSRNISNNPVGV